MQWWMNGWKINHTLITTYKICQNQWMKYKKTNLYMNQIQKSINFYFEKIIYVSSLNNAGEKRLEINFYWRKCVVRLGKLLGLVAIGTFFLTLKKIIFSLVAHPFSPPPPLSGPTTKKRTFFAASLGLQLSCNYEIN